ncbi:CHAT domain-containing protein [Phormidium nigroviride]
MKIKRSHRQFAFLLLLSLLLALAIPPAVAQMQPPAAMQLIQQARTLYDRDRYSEAAPLLQQAVTSFEAQGDRLNQAMALTNLAATYGQLSQWEAAEQTLNSSLSLLQQQSQTLEQQRILAQTHDIQGQIQLERGRVQEALDTWIESGKIYQKIEAPQQLIQNQISQSFALQALGLYPRACKTLLTTLKLEAQTCELSTEGLQTLKNQPVSLENVRATNALGHVLLVLGQLNQSQEVLEVGLQASEQLNIPQEQAAIYLNLGNTVRAQSNNPGLNAEERNEFEQSAIAIYNQAAKLTTQRDTELQANLNQLSLLVDRKDWAEAEVIWRTSIKPKMTQIPSNQAGIYAQINVAQSLMKLSQSSQITPLFIAIESILNQASEQATILGNPRIQAYILAAQGKLYELQQQPSKAETFTTKALGLAPAFQSPDIAYQLLWQLGRIKKAQGNTEDAIAQYSQAVKILSALRGDLVTVNPEVQFSFRESVEPVYRELVGLLLKEDSPSQDKLKFARQTIESLQLAELDNFFRDACADAKPKAIDEVDPTAAVIYPIILSDRLEVIVSIPGKPLRHHSVVKSQEQLETTFRRMRNSLRQTSALSERLPIAQEVYDWLIRPADADFASSGIKTLVFVLDGYLRNLPMAALYDGQQYLLQKYTIALTPGLQLLEAQSLRKVKLQVLTAGLTEARQGFSALPGVASEVQQIADVLPTSSILNEQFISKELQSRLESVSFPIVHLATHGQFSSNAADTFILTWDERVNVKELDRLLRSRSGEKALPIELLVLSACETASGDTRASLGLAGIAIRSGARSTLGTLWQVSDEATAIFMTEFYRQLAKSKISKAEALRNAQVAVMENRQYQNPYFWAPFVIVGNWQ